VASSGVDAATSNAFRVNPGADHLYISPIPTTRAGAAFGDITVKVLNADGTLAANDRTTQVQLYLDDNPGGARFIDANGNPLSTPLLATMTNGVATFSGTARLDKAGVGYTFGVQPLNNALLPRATSNRFVVSAAEPAGLAFQIQPTYTGTTDRINVYNTRLYNSWTGVAVPVVD